MGPKIVLDKSTFQSLSFEEMVVLHKYYFVVVTPILLMEILGDLTKTKLKSDDNIKKAMLLSKKVQQFDSAINSRHNDIILASLLGHKIEMDRRPVVPINKPVVTKDGKKGVIISETPEEKALHRWREGNFSEAEKILSSSWLNITTQPQKLSKIKNKMLSNLPEQIKIESLDKLFELVSQILDNPDYQTDLLKLMLYSFPSDLKYSQRIFLRWEQGDFITIKDFAPYAYFCLRIEHFFYQGLVFDFIGTKSTNDIDLMYLFYLPFCNIFSSDDKFHRKFAKYFIDSDQTFVVGSDLKNDLRQIIKDEYQHENYNHAPQNEDTITYKLWVKHLNWSSRKERHVTQLEKEESKKIVNDVKEIRKSEIDQSWKEHNEKETDFILREFWVGPEDLCPCRSGKKFGECCLPKYKKEK